MGMMKSNWCFFDLILCLFASICCAQTDKGHRLDLICGGVNCEECIPLARQMAPRIGLDLSMSHGTATIFFQNGTTHDLLLVQGTSLYQAAMNDLALEAKLLRLGYQGNLPEIGFLRGSDMPAQPLLQRILPAAVHKALRYLVCPKVNTPPSRDQWVNALAGMVQGLKKEIEQKHDTRDVEIWLSVPDFAWQFEPALQRVREAAAQAGLVVHRYQPQGLTAMRDLHNLDDCWDDDCDCEGDQRHPNVLVVDHSDQRLGLSFYTRWHGLLLTDIDQQEYFHLYPHEYKQITKSGTALTFERLLRKYLASIDQPIDRIVLTGSSATDPLFLSALRTVFEASDDIDEQSYLRDAESHTFASARYSAKLSRLSNMGAFVTCKMPARCFDGKNGALRDADI